MFVKAFKTYVLIFSVMLAPGQLLAQSDALNLLFGEPIAKPALLPVQQAFAYSANATADRLVLDYQVAPGYYLYVDKFKFISETANVRLAEPQIPLGEIKQDEFFGQIESLRGDFRIEIPYAISDGLATTLSLAASLQGCADIGVCYPPDQQTLSISLPASSNASLVASSTTSVSMSEQGLFAGLFQGSYWLIISGFFIAGLLLAFTPCVLPMVPILSGLIVGHGHTTTRSHAFILSLIYVLFMALTFTLAGVAIGLTGANFQAALQTPWILGFSALIFVLLAFSMFGFYTLQMPSGLQTRLQNISNHQHGGSFLGVAIMGVLSALIVGPCVTPPLVGALIYIAQSGDAALGGLALFALSLGMGLPLLIVGTSAGHYLPKAGAWMDKINAVFGVMLLAMAIWLISRVLPTTITMLLWATLFIISGIYLGALEPIHRDASGWYRLWKGFGLLALLTGSLLLIGAAGGSQSLLQPLKGVLANETQASAQQHLKFKPIKGLGGLNEALQLAAQNQQTVMLDFYADWCISCKEMETFTFSDTDVQNALKKSLLIQADVTLNDEQDQALLKQFGLFGPPAILFFNRSGKELTNHRVVGYMSAEKFLKQIQQAWQ